MAKNLVVHIGLQKTGSSSIQVMLASSESYLNSFGYTYPRLPTPKNPKSSVWYSPFRHNCIAGTYADFNSVFEKLDSKESGSFWQELRESPFVPILSAEEFSRQKDFTPLAEALSGFNLHVIVYFRRQDKYIESLYNQRNKILFHRKDLSCLTEDYLTEKDLFEFIKVSGYTHILEYMNLLKRIQSQLRPYELTVRNFKRKSLINQDICADFLHALNLDLRGCSTPSQDANQSISNSILLELKQIQLEKGPKEALDFISNLEQEANNGVSLSGDYALLTEANRSILLEKYYKINLEIQNIFEIDMI